jgi:hypothetical protein
VLWPHGVGTGPQFLVKSKLVLYPIMSIVSFSSLKCEDFMQVTGGTLCQNQ